MLALGSGCCRKPRVKPPIQIIRTDVTCGDKLPEAPKFPAIQWAECEGWETCLTAAEADSLAAWIERALAYQAAVTIECGTAAKEGTP